MSPFAAAFLLVSLMLPLPVAREIMVATGPRQIKLTVASKIARPDCARSVNFSGLGQSFLTAATMSATMASAATTPKKISRDLQLSNAAITAAGLT